MATEDSDFELSAIDPLSSADKFIAAAGGVSSARGNTTLGDIKAYVLDGLDVSDVANAANVVHPHDPEDITGLDTLLDAKLDTDGTIEISQVTGLQTAIDGKADEEHEHTTADVTDLTADGIALVTAADVPAQLALLGVGEIGLLDWDVGAAVDSQTTDLFIVARSGSAASPATNTGAQVAAMVLSQASISSIDGLQTALDAKEDNDSEIPQSRITNLETDLAAKLDASAEIPQSQVTDLVVDLAAKMDASAVIPQNQVEDLDTTLAALTIPIAQISDIGATGADLGAAANPAAARTVLELGSAALADTSDFLAAGADVEIADIAGLQDAFDAKLNVVNPTYEDQLFMPSSSTSAPAIAGAEDTNTGIMLSGADQVGIVTGGYLRAIFGTWGINIGGGSFYEPSVARRPTMQINGLGGDTTEQGVFVGDWAPKSDATSANLRLARVFSGAIGTLTPSESVTSGTAIGSVAWMSSLGTNLTETASIRAAAADTWSTHHPTRLDFYTAGAAEASAIRARLGSDGTLTMYSGPIVTYASTTATSGFRLPHGTAPSSPTNGDVWTTTSGLFARINGTTEQTAMLSGASFTGAIAAASAAITGAITAASAAITGTVKAARFVSEETIIAADDTAFSRTTPIAAGFGIIGTTALDERVMFDYRTGGTASLRFYVPDTGIGSIMEKTTGVLAGTTGTDTKITVSAHTDGKVYAENRRGASKTFSLTWIG